MELGATFNASTMGPVKNSIASICYDALTSKVLVTFQTCEVFEMDGTDGRYASMHNFDSFFFSSFLLNLFSF